ncbi:MAG: PAS domain-containing sensor histidine kinase [Bacteroidetes bacterium]|nr:PAS domain-containing sensor histidine kinase [Bacteroidota bacterium]
MKNAANELFFLNTRLSQLKNSGQVIPLFIDSLKTIFPNTNFSWYPENGNPLHPNFPVCCRNKTFGFLQFDKSLQKDEGTYVLLQNAIQQLAFLLERLMLDQSLESNDRLTAEIIERKKAESMMQEALKRLDTHISSIYAGFIAVSGENKVENVNQAFCDLFNLPSPPASYMGLDSEDMIKKVLVAYADPADTFNRMQKIIAEGKPVRGEELAMRDGRFFLVDFIPILVNGQQCGHIWHHQDITKRKQAEEQLIKSEENQHNILEYGGIGVAFYDLDGTILLLNKRAVQNLGGTDAKQFIGKSLYDFYGQELGSEFVQRLNNVATSSEPVEFEDFVEMANGRRWFSSIHTRSLDNNGKVTGVHVYAHDITERKLTEMALRESNKYLENLFNYANAPIIVWDSQFHITRFNHAFEYLTGRSEAEVTGQSLEILFPPELAEPSMDLIHKTQTGERWETVEIKIQHLDGSVKTVLWNSATIFGSDDITPIATIAQGNDITKRKQAEEELKLKNIELQKTNFEKDKFFSILAHDLRSPFSAFLGFTQLMAEELPTMTLAQIQKIAINMRKSATNLYNLLTNLLEWSRLQRGVTGFKPEVFELNEIITKCIEAVTENAEKKEIEIKIKISENLKISADSQMIQTIIRNLVSNAVKYTPRMGSVEIWAETNKDKSMEVCVRDNGIGMTQDMIDHLFRLDQNINRPGTEGEPSTGLGLIICKEFVEQHGGRIWVESQQGQGSKFYFTIPGGN